MAKFAVQIAETRNYVIKVDAANKAAAEDAAMTIWRDAPEVGGYEITDQSTEIVAATCTTPATDGMGEP